MADAAEQATYWGALTSAWYYMINHLESGGLKDELAAAAPQAISDFQKAATFSGVNTTGLAQNLTELANTAAALGLVDVALTFDKASLAVLQAHPPA